MELCTRTFGRTRTPNWRGRRTLSSKIDDWKGHRLNIGGAVMKDSEGKTFHEIFESEVSIIQGIGPKAAAVMENLNLKTVKDMSNYKFYKIAKAIQVLASTEEDRPEGSLMNLDLALDKSAEAMSLKEILECPVSTLQGLTETADVTLRDLRILTINDLADCRFFALAASIADLVKYENLKTN